MNGKIPTTIMKSITPVEKISIYLLWAKIAFDSAIHSFNEASASSVNWLVLVTIPIYGFCDVAKNFNKVAQYFLTESTDK